MCTLVRIHVYLKFQAATKHQAVSAGLCEEGFLLWTCGSCPVSRKPAREVNNTHTAPGMQRIDSGDQRIRQAIMGSHNKQQVQDMIETSYPETQ